MTTEGRDYSKEAVLARMRERRRPDWRAREAAAWALDGLALVLLAAAAVRIALSGSAQPEVGAVIFGLSGPAAGFALAPIFFIARFARPAPTPLGWLWLAGFLAMLGWLLYRMTL